MVIMTKLYKIIKIKLFLCCLLASTIVYGGGSSVAKVNKVKGNAFIVDGKKMKRIRKGQNIPDFAEIITSETARISFSDYYDHEYHLAGSGHIRFFNKILEVKRGHLWVQSHRKTGHFMIQSANAQAIYAQGEFVFSFNGNTGKSQLLVISGEISFSNPTREYGKLMLNEGQFSFVDNNYNMGLPRRATFIGRRSFKKITSLFKGIKIMSSPSHVRQIIALNEKKHRSRRPASIDKGPRERSKDPGKLLIVRKSPSFAPSFIKKEKTTMELYLEKLAAMRDEIPQKRSLKKKKTKTYKKNKIRINIFRASSYEPPKKFKQERQSNITPVKQNNMKSSVKKNRTPASIRRPALGMEKQNAFEQSLSQAYKKQFRHTKEVDNLIKELESYQQIYNEDQ